MKASTAIIILTLAVAAMSYGSAPVYASEWTAEQKEIIDWFNQYTKISLKGNLDEIWSHFHIKFSGWDYSKRMNDAPFGKEWLKGSQREFYENYKLISFDVQPLDIKTLGDLAIIHANFMERYKGSDGNEITDTGPWTSALIRQDGKWLFLSWSFAFK